jgi:NAD(P)-dependent dehydrogenase (short-subunit alcohol dehydrogenase family)
VSSLLQRALDRSVVFSFDRTGFRRHRRGFLTVVPRALGGASLITGGTAGIGLAIARGLAEAGSRPLLWGRNEDKGRDAERAIPGSAFTSVDLGDLPAVSRAAWAVEGPLDAVVLNAGAMPLERRLTAQGHELMWASQVLGHLLLLRVLHSRGLLGEGTRVVWVSSGGMYLQRLDLRDLTFEARYERHSVYANAKRAQVMLARHLAERWPETWMASMHPGWVDTEAVQHSMPVFRAITRPILRTAEEGADTVVWLGVHEDVGPSGRFWFDRSEQPEHTVARTRPSEDALPALVDCVFGATEPFLEAPS